MRSDEELLLSPREALILGVIAEEFSATRPVVALYAESREPELDDWIHRKHFLEFMRLRCRPFFPGVYTESFTEISGVPAPPDTDWVTFGDQRFGLARSKPSLLFHAGAGDASERSEIRTEHVELSCSLIGSVAASLGDLVKRRPVDDYYFPVSVQSWLRARIAARGQFQQIMTSRSGPAGGDLPPKDFWAFHGADDHVGIMNRLRQLAEFNEHSEPFDVGRGLGTLLAHYVERLDYCCEFPCREVPYPEPGGRAEARITSTAKVIEHLLGSNLVKKHCPLARLSLESEATQCYLEGADSPEVSTSHQAIWFVAGALAESLREQDSVVAGYDAERMHQRSELPVGGTPAEIEVEIRRFGRAALSDIDVSGGGLEHWDVFKLDSNIEWMAKRIWPNETRTLEARREFKLGPFLERMQKEDRNKLRASWARKALSLYKIRNQRMHGAGDFRPTRQESKTFFQEMLWLLEKFNSLS